MAEFVTNISIILKISKESKTTERFVNVCNCIKRFVEKYPKFLSKFENLIECLLDTVSNEIGLMRKNAAILLGSLSKNEENLERIRDLHGIEILNSIVTYI